MHHADFYLNCFEAVESEVFRREISDLIAQIAGIEYLLIDEETKLHQFQKELGWNCIYYGLARGF